MKKRLTEKDVDNLRRQHNIYFDLLNINKKYNNVEWIEECEKTDDIFRIAKVSKKQKSAL